MFGPDFDLLSLWEAVRAFSFAAILYAIYAALERWS